MPDSKSDIRLRPLGSPSPVQVRTDRKGHPIEIRRGARGWKGGRVASIQETWKIDDEWWRQPISRLYRQVILENGKMMTLYRDLTDGSWYVQ